MGDWTDSELETARLRIRDASQREQSALFTSPTSLSDMNPHDREGHLTLSRELAIDIEATRTSEIWKHRVEEPDAPARWTQTLENIRNL